MSVEKIAQIIRDEVTASQPCSCCGSIDIDGIDKAAQKIAEAIVAKQSTETCDHGTPVVRETPSMFDSATGSVVTFEDGCQQYPAYTS